MTRVGIVLLVLLLYIYEVPITYLSATTRSIVTTYNQVERVIFCFFPSRHRDS